MLEPVKKTEFNLKAAIASGRSLCVFVVKSTSSMDGAPYDTAIRAMQHFTREEGVWVRCYGVSGAAASEIITEEAKALKLDSPTQAAIKAMKAQLDTVKRKTGVGVSDIVYVTDNMLVDDGFITALKRAYKGKVSVVSFPGNAPTPAFAAAADSIWMKKRKKTPAARVARDPAAISDAAARLRLTHVPAPKKRAAPPKP